MVAAGARAVQSTPLVSRSGRVLGMFSTHYDRAPQQPTERALRLLDILARQAADLIEQKQSEEALRAKDADLERVINQTPFMLTRCSRDLRYQFVSRTYAEMMGRQPADIAGKPIVEIMGEEGFETIRPYIETVLNGTRVEFESDLNIDGAGIRSLRVVYTPDTDERGRIQGWIASILDVSDRKQGEEARALLAGIVESSDDAIISKSLNGIITSWNAGAERIFGYAAAEAIGQSIGIIIPPERQHEEIEIIQRLSQGETIEHFETQRVAKGWATMCRSHSPCRPCEIDKASWSARPRLPAISPIACTRMKTVHGCWRASRPRGHRPRKPIARRTSSWRPRPTSFARH